MTEFIATFQNCTGLKKVNLTGFDTTKVQRMDFMFNLCESLTVLDISSFNLENLKNSRRMFNYCFNLKEIIFNNNTMMKNLETMEGMFVNCRSLEYINTKI